jgi:hypothetical protein
MVTYSLSTNENVLSCRTDWKALASNIVSSNLYRNKFDILLKNFFQAATTPKMRPPIQQRKNIYIKANFDVKPAVKWK